MPPASHFRQVFDCLEGSEVPLNLVEIASSTGLEPYLVGIAIDRLREAELILVAEQWPPSFRPRIPAGKESAATLQSMKPLLPEEIERAREAMYDGLNEVVRRFEDQ